MLDPIHSNMMAVEQFGIWAAILPMLGIIRYERLCDTNATIAYLSGTTRSVLGFGPPSECPWLREPLERTQPQQQ